MDIADVMPNVWRVSDVSQQPSVTLTQWRVFELPDGSRHFSGWAVESREGRASSAIRAFDPISMRGVTASGRVYQLKGKSGWTADAECVWNTWARINHAATWNDVSKEVVAAPC